MPGSIGRPLQFQLYWALTLPRGVRGRYFWWVSSPALRAVLGQGLE